MKKRHSIKKKLKINPMKKILLLMIFVVTVASCTTYSKVVKKLAEYDFNCPAENIETKYLSGILLETEGNYFATGCGKKTSYKCESNMACSRISEIKEHKTN